MSVATIAAGLPFVDALAAGLLAEAGDHPLGLADALVLLPTRRACRSLGEAFVRRSSGHALLLPRIQPIGEIEADELILDGTLELALPPAIGSLRRQLLLARLLAPLRWPLEHALRLAGELAALLDELQTERVALDALDRLVPDALAEHWQKSRELLAIIAEAWPKVLAEQGALDAAERRHRLLTALAARWRADPPAGRIVAAGSTGSIPATRALLQVIARLPCGTVVLPGLDQELDDASWRQLEPGHPQYGLKQLLEALAIERAAVHPWAAPGVVGADPARARFLSEVMRPSATVGAWQALPPPPAAAVRELVIEEHPDLPAEALALAQGMRGALEVPGRTAALVTPDRHLARRVAVELQRWGIEVDDSAGTPLDQTPPGAFLLLTARLIVEGVNPVVLLATLKHPLAAAGLERGELRRLTRGLEKTCLRGPRLAGGFTGIQVELERARRRAGNDADKGQRCAALAAFARRIEHAARPFADVVGGRRPVGLAALVRAHLDFAEELARTPDPGAAGGLWAREAGEAAGNLFAELLDAAEGALPILPAAYPAALAQLMAARPVRPRGPRHPRLHIWGQLEARLQHAGLLLLGGLNEGVWPRFVEPGPWLSGSMREALGLPPIERRIGLSAHDFAAAAAAGAVVLSRAEKDAQGSPTVPSRWLVRLKTLLAGSGGYDIAAQDRRAWARLDDGPVTRPHPRPAPKPPVGVRPRSLSVSDIGLWMSDPYALYAKRILGLRPLEALEADPGALERGIIIHRVLERFVGEFPGELPADAERRLLDLGQQLFADFSHRPQVRALWWPRFEQIARWVIGQERARRAQLLEIRTEVEGRLELEGLDFVLKARADRIERLPDGQVTLIDYKTGALPKPSDVSAGLAPQLPLEAAMVEAGAFEGLEPAAVAGLLFWQLKGDETGGEEQAPAKIAPAELAAGALAGLRRLVAHYDRPETAYPARSTPQVAWRGDYDHLARRGEWTS
jgi:ATP-dependent helicase/nuclease subunit B